MSAVLPAAISLNEFLVASLYQAAGLTVVILALGSLAVAIVSLSRAVARLTAVAGGPSLDPALVAAIAAAIHVALGRPARVVALHDAGDPLRAWTAEGRRQIFQSHRVR